MSGPPGATSFMNRDVDGNHAKQYHVKHDAGLDDSHAPTQLDDMAHAIYHN